MTIKIVKNGKELGIGEAMAYLTRRHGIPDTDVRMLAVEGEVGQPLLITVQVYAQAEPREVAVDLDRLCPNAIHRISALNSRGGCDQCEMMQ